MASSCRRCGADLGEGAAYCSACGTRVSPTAATPLDGPALTGEAPATTATTAATTAWPEHGPAPAPLRRPRREPETWARLLSGSWALPLTVAAPALVLLGLSAFVVAWGMLRGGAWHGLLVPYAAATVGATFGGDVDVTSRWARGGGVLDRIITEHIGSLNVSTVPLTLTVLTLAALAVTFRLRTRRLPDSDLLPAAVKTCLCLAGGVAVVTLAGRLGTGRAGEGGDTLDGAFTSTLRLDVHASTLGSAGGALVAAALALAVTVVVARPTLLSGWTASARSALAAPAWVLLLFVAGTTVLGGLALLVGVLVRGDGASLSEVSGAAAVLPNVAAWLLATTLGPGIEVRQVKGDLGGARDADGLAKGTLHLSDLGHASATAWLLPVGLLLVFLLVGLLLVTRYDSPSQARRGGLITAALAVLVVTPWCAVSGVDMNSISEAALSARPAGLAVGVWTGLLVAASAALATAILPRLPHPVLRALAFVARRPAATAPAPTAPTRVAGEPATPPAVSGPDDPSA